MNYEAAWHNLSAWIDSQSHYWPPIVIDDLAFAYQQAVAYGLKP